MDKTNRRQQILEALAQMLQEHPGDRITTANLAKKVGVSEAALYRHFPSKAKMLEGLILFAEETLFSRINLIMKEHPHAPARCRNMIYLMLSFIERNPGFARLFVGDVLQGESTRLRNRMHQLLERLETQARQLLREYNASRTETPNLQISPAANLVMAYVEGKIAQFVHSEFTESPTRHWEEQWLMLEVMLFNPSGRA